MAAWSYKEHLINGLLWFAAGDMLLSNLQSVGNRRAQLGIAAVALGYAADMASPMIPF